MNTARTSVRPRVFTFWEPREKVIPYLELCRETWGAALEGFEIITLDYSNLPDIVDPQILDLDTLKHLTLPMQKDAIEAAVLNLHGGLFLDMDTIILGDISHILDYLKRTEVVMFGQHLAFVASRQGSMLTTRWLEEVRKRLAQIANREFNPSDLRWDYLGNSIVADIHRRMIDNSALLRLIRRSPIGKKFWKVRNNRPNKTLGASQSDNNIPARQGPITKLLRSLVYSYHRKELIMLDPMQSGFIAESRISSGSMTTVSERYRQFWFNTQDNRKAVTIKGTSVIALHNSWNPDWFQKLSREEVLANECLLSSVLREIVNPIYSRH